MIGSRSKSMPRFLRRILVASVVAFHAAIMLCGPCLHALPGSGHGSDSVSHATHHPDQDSAKPLQNPIDYCPICHFMTQGQLAVWSSCGLSAQLLAEFVPAVTPASLPPSFEHLSPP